MTEPGAPTVDSSSASTLSRLASRLPALCGTIALVVAGTVLLGWALNVRVLQSFLPGLVTMKANTAVGLASLAAALLLHSANRSFAARALAVLAISLGVATTVQYVARVDLGIDQLLFPAPEDAAFTSTPGRMALATALDLVLGGLALVFGGVSTAAGRRPSRWFALACGGMALTALLGYVYGVIPTAGLGQGVQIAPHTALTLVVLAIGTLTLEPEGSIVQTLVSSGPGGSLARRLLPMAFVAPLLLGLLPPLTAVFGYAGGELGTASLAVATTFLFATIIWRTAESVNVADGRRREAEQGVMQLRVEEEGANARAAVERVARSIAENAREQTQQAMHEKEDALRLLDLVLDSTPVGVAFFDSALRYQRVNPAYAAFNGVPVADYAGRALRDVTPEIADVIEPELRLVASSTTPTDDNGTTTRSGQVSSHDRHWSFNAYPVRSGRESIVGVGLTLIEETTRWRLEAQLRQSQKMEAVGQLAGGIAHDFNNVLTVVGGYAQMLLADLAPHDRNRQLAEQIDLAAVRATKLTQQLLAFGRRQMLQPRIVNLNDTVRGIQPMLQQLIRTDIVIDLRLADDLGLVRADEGQIEQVLTNLAANARDAMPAGGTLSIQTENAEMDSGFAHRHGATDVPSGPCVILSVGDTGTGMSPEVQARIFEPFYSTKDAGKGTGLGLAMVYGIVKQSGGFIWCYSEPGLGTRFRIYLPRVEGERVKARQEAAVTIDHAPTGERILLVDDDPAVRAAAAMFLQRRGYRVTAAQNGREAATILDNSDTPFDLLMTDVVMPDINGHELASFARAHFPEMKVLLTSGFTQGALPSTDLDMRDVAFVEKPYALDALARTLRSLLDGPGSAGD